MSADNGFVRFFEKLAQNGAPRAANIAEEFLPRMAARNDAPLCALARFSRRASAAMSLYRLADAARDRYRSRHSTPEQAHGRRGEDLAHRFLRRNGLTIVARNFRQRAGRGELDIVAWDRQTLVFVEVKTRASAEFGSPGRAIGTHKETDLRRAAGEYLRRSGAPPGMSRFDLVNIVLADPPEIEWIKDAFPVSRTL